MIKILSSIVLAGSLTFASEYYAKVEPIKIYNIKSAVSGKVIYTNEGLDGQNIKNDIVVKIDANINNIDLKQSKIKLTNLKDILAIEKDTLKSFNKVSSKSRFDKDMQKIKILNMVSSISDLTTKIESLKDTIKKKVLTEQNRFIYDIVVDKGDFVNPGTLLYTAMDLSKSKLTIFIPIDIASNIKKKTIYIDGKETDLKITRLYTVADTKHISSYKCEIELPTQKQFSKLVKIEFK